MPQPQAQKIRQVLDALKKKHARSTLPSFIPSPNPLRPNPFASPGMPQVPLPNLRSVMPQAPLPDQRPVMPQVPLPDQRPVMPQAPSVLKTSSVLPSYNYNPHPLRRDPFAPYVHPSKKRNPFAPPSMPEASSPVENPLMPKAPLPVENLLMPKAPLPVESPVMPKNLKGLPPETTKKDFKNITPSLPNIPNSLQSNILEKIESLGDENDVSGVMEQDNPFDATRERNEASQNRAIENEEEIARINKNLLEQQLSFVNSELLDLEINHSKILDEEISKLAKERQRLKNELVKPVLKKSLYNADNFSDSLFNFLTLSFSDSTDWAQGYSAPVGDIIEEQIEKNFQHDLQRSKELQRIYNLVDKELSEKQMVKENYKKEKRQLLKDQLSYIEKFQGNMIKNKEKFSNIMRDIDEQQNLSDKNEANYIIQQSNNKLRERELDLRQQDAQIKNLLEMNREAEESRRLAQREAGKDRRQMREFQNEAEQQARKHSNQMERDAFNFYNTEKLEERKHSNQLQRDINESALNVQEYQQKGEEFDRREKVKRENLKGLEKFRSGLKKDEITHKGKVSVDVDKGKGEEFDRREGVKKENLKGLEKFRSGLKKDEKEIKQKGKLELEGVKHLGRMELEDKKAKKRMELEGVKHLGRVELRKLKSEGKTNVNKGSDIRDVNVGSKLGGYNLRRRSSSKEVYKEFTNEDVINFSENFRAFQTLHELSKSYIASPLKNLAAKTGLSKKSYVVEQAVEKVVRALNRPFIAGSGNPSNVEQELVRQMFTTEAGWRAITGHQAAKFVRMFEDYKSKYINNLESRFEDTEEKKAYINKLKNLNL